MKTNYYLTSAFRRTNFGDIQQASDNYIEIENGSVLNQHGPNAALLLNSPDWSICPFPFSVWELTGDCHDWRTDCAKPVAILRSNQSNLSASLNYMAEGRILVWNKDCRHLETE